MSDGRTAVTLPWSGVGYPGDGAGSAREAFGRAGLGWEVGTEPVYLEGGREVPRTRAVVRLDSRAPLGTVSPTWQPVQNWALADLCDSVVGVSGAKIESVGQAKGGRIVWCLVELPGGFSVAGDEMKSYMLLSNSHDGSQALRGCITPLRVICSNALRLAERRGSSVVSVRHTPSADARLEHAKRVLSFAVEDLGRFKVQAEALAARSMTEREVGDFAASMFPIPADGEPDSHPRILAAREAVVSRTLGDGIGLDRSAIRATRWSALQGLAEYLDHGRRYRTAEARFSATMLDGTGSLKRRALVYLSQN